jgi:hypothetical protein
MPDDFKDRRQITAPQPIRIDQGAARQQVISAMPGEEDPRSPAMNAAQCFAEATVPG